MPVCYSGHIVGGLIGIFLGWGIGPTLVEPTEQESRDQDDSKDQKAKIVTVQSQSFGDALSSSSEKPGKLRRKVEPLGGIRQVSISASLLAGDNCCPARGTCSYCQRPGVVIASGFLHAGCQDFTVMHFH